MSQLIDLPHKYVTCDALTYSQKNILLLRYPEFLNEVFDKKRPLPPLHWCILLQDIDSVKHICNTSIFGYPFHKAHYTGDIPWICNDGIHIAAIVGNWDILEFLLSIDIGRQSLAYLYLYANSWDDVKFLHDIGVCAFDSVRLPPIHQQLWYNKLDNCRDCIYDYAEKLENDELIYWLKHLPTKTSVKAPDTIPEDDTYADMPSLEYSSEDEYSDDFEEDIEEEELAKTAQQSFTDSESEGEEQLDREMVVIDIQKPELNKSNSWFRFW